MWHDAGCGAVPGPRLQRATQSSLNQDTGDKKMRKEEGSGGVLMFSGGAVLQTKSGLARTDLESRWDVTSRRRSVLA